MKISEIAKALMALAEKHGDPEVHEVWTTMRDARAGLRDYELVLETRGAGDLEVPLDL